MVVTFVNVFLPVRSQGDLLFSGEAGKLSGCKGGAIASDETKRVRKRKRCTKENRQPYQCQIDVKCLDGEFELFASAIVLNPFENGQEE